MIKLLTDNAGKRPNENYTKFMDMIKKTLSANLDIPISELEQQIECDECHAVSRRLVDEWKIIKTIEIINPNYVGPKYEI